MSVYLLNKEKNEIINNDNLKERKERQITINSRQNK